LNHNKNLDRIRIRDLSTRCILGINSWEREKMQDIILSITLHADLSAAGRSDNLEDSVDYKALKNRILEMVEPSRFYLIEGLAEAIADLCLENPRVKEVEVVVDKPGALRFARSVGVEINRRRKDG
jgi:D-erythro-7,8-dihydroneopterin triphosphate epimerase